MRQNTNSIYGAEKISCNAGEVSRAIASTIPGNGLTLYIPVPNGESLSTRLDNMASLVGRLGYQRGKRVLLTVKTGDFSARAV